MAPIPSLPLKPLSYPSQNAVFEMLSFSVRHKLVAQTKSKSLNVSNKIMAFHFDYVSVSVFDIEFDDSISFHFENDKVVMRDYLHGKGKARSKEIGFSVSCDTAKRMVYNYYLDRPGTEIRRLNVKHSSALRLCPNLHVRDELKIYTCHWIPTDLLLKLHGVQPLKMVEIHQDNTDNSDIFRLPIIASAKNWSVSRVDVDVILESKATTISIKGSSFDGDSLKRVYQKWKAENREIGTSLDFCTADCIQLYVHICSWPENEGISKIGNKPWSVKNIPMSETTRVVIRELTACKVVMEVVPVTEEKQSCCRIC